MLQYKGRPTENGLFFDIHYSSFTNKKTEGVSKMVKIEHLVKSYGQNFALDDVSFTVEKGEVVLNDVALPFNMDFLIQKIWIA